MLCLPIGKSNIKIENVHKVGVGGPKSGQNCDCCAKASPPSNQRPPCMALIWAWISRFVVRYHDSYQCCQTWWHMMPTRWPNMAAEG